MTNHELQITSIDLPIVVKPADVADGWAKPSWSSHSNQVAIGFSTNLDLWDFAQSKEYNVVVEVSACTGQELDPTRELQSSVYLYTYSGSFNSLSDKRPSDAGRYRIYFSSARFPTASDTFSTFSYDLAANPLDVCFRLRGGNMLGGSFYSNIVVIPGTAIRNAMSGIMP